MATVPCCCFRLCLGIVLGACFAGCNPSQKIGRLQDKYIARSEDLCKQYLKSDVSEARICLLENAKLLEEATVLEPIGRSQLLSKNHLRLYVLERRVGNEATAEANLIKAKYWALRNSELMGVALDSAIHQISENTFERIVQYIDEH